MTTLESLHFPTTRATLVDYIRTNTGRADVAFFGIMLKNEEQNLFIGTAKIGPVEWIHRHAYVALFIGEAAARSHGYGTEVVRLLLRYGFHVLNLHKISAGIVGSNTASIRLFKKVGMTIEAIRKDQFWVDGRWEDHVLMAMFDTEFEAGEA